MKPPVLLQSGIDRTSAATALIAVSCLVFASTAFAAITTGYPAAAYQLATKYAGENPTSDAKAAADLEKEDAFKVFLTSQGLKPAGKLAKAVSALVLSLRTAAKKADDEGVEMDPSKPAYRLVQQEAAAEALNVSIDVLGGRAAPTASQSSAATAESIKPPKEPAAEVLATDQLDYDGLKLDERKINADIETAQKIVVPTSKESEAKKAAAASKIATLERQLNENRAHQTLLRAKLAADTATKAADKPATTNDKTKAALAAAAQKAETDQVQAQAAYDALHAQLPDNRANFSNIQAFFHTGATLLNPYHIIPADKTASPPTKMSVEPASSTDTNAFLEFIYSNRWAWNAQRVVNEFSDTTTSNDLQMFNTNQVDVQARLGYTFASGSTSTANTLVGSGNFNGEVAVAKPFVLFRAIDGTIFSVGAEGGYGAVTDRSALKAHPRGFWGMAFTTSFKDPFQSKDNDDNVRRVLLHFRTGWAKIDAVQYIDQTTSKDIYETNGSLPKFQKISARAFETELFYPIKTSTFVTFASRVYTEVNPNPWSVQIGITTSFGDLLDGFFK
jgi:hypothetical protein